MEKLNICIFSVALIANTYATVKAIKSFIKFNKHLKEIDCYNFRQDVKRYSEEVEIRET